jgi:hypothetical protein
MRLRIEDPPPKKKKLLSTSSQEDTGGDVQTQQRNKPRKRKIGFREQI